MRAAAPVIFPFLGAIACSATPTAPAPIPALGELNPHVLRLFAAYPQDGSYGYWWPKGSAWEGTTQDLVYDGKTIAKGDPQKRSYCCGLTFEILFRAWEAWCKDRGLAFRIGNLNAAGVDALRRDWYGTDGNRKTLQRALVERGLGVGVEKLEDARAGDFVQFWRRNDSGHSAVFLDWERKNGKIVGIVYGSTQGSTKGIGVGRESFEGEKGVDPAQIYLARVGKPRR